MKLFAFILVIVGGFMLYLGITGKKLTIGGTTFGGGSGGGVGVTKTW